MAIEIKSLTVHAQVSAGASRDERAVRGAVGKHELERLRRDVLKECQRMLSERDRRARER